MNLLVPIFSALAAVGIVLALNLARMSGWKAIASHYAVTVFPSAGRRNWISGRLGLFLYRNISVVADDRGLYLRTIPCTAVFHVPLFVPWEEVSVGPTKGLFPVRLTFQRSPAHPLGLCREDAQKLLALAPGAVTQHG
jgi:hypothetical protein